MTLWTQGAAGLALAAAAPLTVWAERRVKAWAQMRQGPGPWQPYRDMRRLLAKDVLYPTGASPFYRLAPILALGTAATALLTLPLYHTSDALGGGLALLVLALVLGLYRLILAMQAYDTGTAFGGLGSSRELFLGGLGEPVLLLVAAVVFIATGSAGIPPHALSLSEPVLWLIVASLTMLWIAESARIPFDNPATHLELTMVHEAMILEASGWILAAYEGAAALKQVTFAALLILFVAPLPSDGPLRLLYLILGAVTLSGVLGLVESGVAKVRLFRASHLLVMAALLAFMGGVVLFATRGAL